MSSYFRIRNKIEPQHQDAIVEAYTRREDVAHFTALKSHEDIAANDYNFSVSSYVEQEDNREEIDIEALNA
ncbi:MAG: SAM-dependent methyltransferase [Bacteroidales bacterium]|nr:N-6 DNA methylase [Candidatus Colimorpha merdihippi]MCQ2282953.1 SAM-dependent methyltransferase [Bacteroidales bacterium]